jgi:hypothetical protein
MLRRTTSSNSMTNHAGAATAQQDQHHQQQLLPQQPQQSLSEPLQSQQRPTSQQSSRQLVRTRSSRRRRAPKQDLEEQRRRLQAVEPKQLCAMLKQVFEAYCDKQHFTASGVHGMTVGGFMRLLYDCCLMEDNTVTPAVVVELFHGAAPPPAVNIISVQVGRIMGQLLSISRHCYYWLGARASSCISAGA